MKSILESGSAVIRTKAPLAEQYLCWLLIAAGVVLRVREYLNNRPLWLDESGLALNIVTRSFRDLLAPLEPLQVAPVGFLWLERAAVELGGPSELSLRLFPLIAGVVSLFLFYFAVRQTFGLRAATIGLAWVSFSGPLIYYSDEVKQYSSDVMVCLAILMTASHLYERKHLSPGYAIACAIGGSIAVWLSHSSALVLGSTGSVLIILCLVEGRRKQAMWLSAIAACWLGSFTVSYFVSLRHNIGNPGLHEYWQEALGPRSVFSAPQWLYTSFFNAFENPGGVHFTGLAGTFFLLALLCRSQRETRPLLLWCSPIVAAMAAAVAKLYPFEGRLLLFLAPILAAVSAAGVVRLVDALSVHKREVVSVTLIILLLEPWYRAVKTFVHPTELEDIRSALMYVEAHAQPGDHMFLPWSTQVPFAFYKPRYHFTDLRIIHGIKWRGFDVEPYRKDLNQLQGLQRVWIVFSHDFAGDRKDAPNWAFFLEALNQLGTQLDSFHAQGSAVYLYRLTVPHQDAVPTKAPP
jgi:4-amino-4-deoxy-L-arabinose transferase-like glycosyltransferase